ncbi:MAG: serine hydrolase [Gemmataceae bacterium]|nr:serine hydrolase [Gemmataceae bacterium]
MHRATVTFALFLWLSTPLHALAEDQKTRLADKDEVTSALRLLEAWVESQIDYRGLPGMSLAVVHDQELVWSKGFGYADLEKKTPATPGTIYRIASISKVFTATAVLHLRDRGKLQLDDPVEKHLRWFRVQNQSADAPVITIRHLLTHTSGLPRESAFPYWTDFKFPTREEMVQALPNQEAVYAPETKWKYSNLALALAGEVVAAASGEPYEKYVQEQILRPLGMESTSVVLPASHRERLATGHGRRLPPDGKREVRPFTDTKGITPAAGLASTAEDLARFASLQFRDGPASGGQVLKGSTLREMHRVHWLQPDWKSGWGLGFSVIHREERDLVGHGGWVAGYQTAVYFSPKEKVAVIALINADDGLPYPGTPDSVVDRAFKWVAPALVKAAAAPVVAEKAKPEWQKYVGKYRNPWGDGQVLVLDGKLVLINPTEQDPTGTKATLVPLAEHTFRLEGGAPTGPHGERVVFELGKDGQVVRVKVGANYTYPRK